MPDIKFAVVREDPTPEIECANRLHAKRSLLVASGGCSAFALQHQLPDLSIDLFDVNPNQLQHVANRAQAVQNRDYDGLNIENDDPAGLSQCGVFEKFFRIFRQVMVEFVVSAGEIESFFQAELSERRRLFNKWVTSPYWELLFHICFNDDFLKCLFGEEAIQHGARNSYVDYFRQRFEWGLFQESSHCNYFLHSILLGRYQRLFAPPFLTSGQRYSFNYHIGTLLELDTIRCYDLISLSNIFDWCDQNSIARYTTKLKEMKTGSILILRQLNNLHSLRPQLQSAFSFDHSLGKYYQSTDRSLFYNTIEVATRMSDGATA